MYKHLLVILKLTFRINIPQKSCDFADDFYITNSSQEFLQNTAEFTKKYRYDFIFITFWLNL